MSKNSGYEEKTMENLMKSLGEELNVEIKSGIISVRDFLDRLEYKICMDETGGRIDKNFLDEGKIKFEKLVSDVLNKIDK